MPCNHPLKAFYTGCSTDAGKDDFFICPSTAGDLLNVELLEKKHRKFVTNSHMVNINGKVFLKDPLAIPCGKCQGCRSDRAKVWKIRNCLERQYHKYCYFVTLTYEDKALPTTKDGIPTILKSDLQKFFKRLRNRGFKFSYFASGEYGSSTKRPHYHVLIYTDDDFALVPTGVNKYSSGVVADCWTFGLHECSYADPGLIAYTSGYVEKKLLNPDYDDYPVKPFLLMSKMPAIGMRYLVDHDLSKTFKVYGQFGSSHSAGIPQAFKKKLENEVWFNAYKELCYEQARKSSDMTRVVYGCKYETVALEAREQSMLAQVTKIRKESL